MDDVRYDVINLPDRDPVESMVGKLTKVNVKGRGRNFAAMCFLVKNGEVWFKNRRGFTWMIRREDIRSISEIMPREA